MTQAQLNELVVCGELAIVAGSDTTSTTLSGVFFYLLTHPECYDRLRKEVNTVFPPGEDEPFDGARLAETKYLNAAINETLRIQPAVPTAIQRAPEKGTGGKWISEDYIPEGTAVNIPPYVLHHNPKYFSPMPDSFMPERWLNSEKTLSSEKVVHYYPAFIPFSAGHANCAGKNLAMAEMRVVTALLMQKFDIRFAPGYDPARWTREMIDLFIMKPSDLPVDVITLRE